MKPFELLSFHSSRALADTAALAWLEEIERANRAGQTHCVALSGGRITQEFFSMATHRARTRFTSFRNVHFFWADERCVPPSDSQNNYHIARELLFEPLNIQPSHIHRIRGEDTPTAAAALASEDLRHTTVANQQGMPVLDLIFLGLGEDGHVASLFPGEPVDTLPNVYRAVENSPKPPAQRISLDYAVIAAARKVWMLASGTGKDLALHESLSPSGVTPFARVLSHRRDTRIFTDICTTEHHPNKGVISKLA